MRVSRTTRASIDYYVPEFLLVHAVFEVDGALVDLLGESVADLDVVRLVAAQQPLRNVVDALGVRDRHRSLVLLSAVLGHREDGGRNAQEEEEAERGGAEVRHYGGGERRRESEMKTRQSI